MKERKEVLTASLLVVGFASLIGAWYCYQRPYVLVLLFPKPAVYYFFNLFPAGVVFIAAGALLRSQRKDRIRLTILLLGLLVVSCIPTFRLWGEPASVSQPGFFADGTARQSSSDTCSAASMVTLLKQHGIWTTEKKMAELARTKLNRGTHPLGIYRGLCLAIEDTTATLSVRYDRVNFEDLLALATPAIITVGLAHAPETELEQTMMAKYQWSPGVMHSVVLLGNAAELGKVAIADPDFGIENWPAESARVLYQGTAIWLVHHN